MNFFLLTFLVVTAAGLAVVIYRFLQYKEKEYVSKSLDMSLFLVSMPKHMGKKESEKKEEKVLIGQMEQVLSNFLHLEGPSFFERVMYGSPRVALEIASKVGGKDICFYVAVPCKIEGAFEKYVQGVYNRALVEKIPKDYTIFEPKGKTSGCYLELTADDILPISTYKKLDKDPLASITNSLSKIEANEGAAIQVVIRRSRRSWKKFGRKIIKRLKKGYSFKKASFNRSFFVRLMKELAKIFFPAKRAKQKKQQAADVDEDLVKAVQKKIQKPIFETNVRIITSAGTQQRADDILDHIEGSFGQFSLFVPNSLKGVELEGNKLEELVYNFSFRNFDNSQKIHLNIEELTSIYHFPTYYLETPYIKSVKSRVSEPPIDLPEEGVNLLGKVKFRGKEKEVRFANRRDRRRHCYLVGQTGTGKTGLLSEMIRHDLEAGEGLGVIDPHGDLIEDVLANIPKERVDDVVLFDPSDAERPVGLNMLEWETEAQKDFAIQEIISIFYKLFSSEAMGPIFEHSMRNALSAVMADRDNPGTLIDVSRIFKDEDFLDKKLEKVKNPMVKRFWEKEWKAQPESGHKAEMRTYVVSKIGRFLESTMMRNIIGQQHSGFDLNKIMDEGKIFLANLSKGSVGEMNTALLGLVLVSKIQMSAMRRSKMPEEERRDFYLYIDEFQNFTTDSIATILSEARKYHLNLIMAHQYIPQLEDEIREAVFGNTGTIGALRVGADDAEFLEKQFEPEFSRFDLVNLNNYKAILKMIIDNSTTKPFKVDLLPPKKGDPEQVSHIKKIARLKYGKPRSIVEDKLS